MDSPYVVNTLLHTVHILNKKKTSSDRIESNLNITTEIKTDNVTLK